MSAEESDLVWLEDTFVLRSYARGLVVPHDRGPTLRSHRDHRTIGWPTRTPQLRAFSLPSTGAGYVLLLLSGAAGKVPTALADWLKELTGQRGMDAGQLEIAQVLSYELNEWEDPMDDLLRAAMRL